MLTVCEELGEDAKVTYHTNVPFSSPDRSDEVCTVVLCQKNLSDKSLRRMMQSPRAGWRLVSDHLSANHMLFRDFLASIAPRMDPFIFTAALKQPRVEGSWLSNNHYVAEAQAGGFEAEAPVILEWLLREGFYKPERNRPSMIVSCGNELGLKILIREGHDVNFEDQRGYRALNYRFQNANMVDVLLDCGAKVDLLREMVPPSVAALRRLLQLRPVETRAKFSSEAILNNCDYPLRYAEVMLEFGFPTPDTTHMIDPWGSIAGALFTFGFTNRRPEYGHISNLLWPHMHYAFPQATKECVATALLCFKRVCPHLPRDMRNLLLVGAFGKLLY